MLLNKPLVLWHSAYCYSKRAEDKTHKEKVTSWFSFCSSKSVPIRLMEVLLFIHRRLICPRGKRITLLLKISSLFRVKFCWNDFEILMLAVIHLSPNTPFFFWWHYSGSFGISKPILLTYCLTQLNKNGNILKQKVTVLFLFHTERL